MSSNINLLPACKVRGKVKYKWLLESVIQLVFFYFFFFGLSKTSIHLKVMRLCFICVYLRSSSFNRTNDILD